MKKDLGKELNFSLGICIDSHQTGQGNEKLGWDVKMGMFMTFFCFRFLKYL